MKMDATTKLNSIPLANGTLNLNNNVISNLSPAVVSTDAVNKNQLDTGLAGKLSTSTRLDQLLPPMAAVDMNG